MKELTRKEKRAAYLKAYKKIYRKKNKDKIKLYALEYRKNNKKKTNAHNLLPHIRFKNKARKALQHYIATGKIVRQPCEVCGEKKSEAHHEDYNKPFDVIWLCKKHHTEVYYG